jgi:hypothetical protein
MPARMSRGRVLSWIRMRCDWPLLQLPERTSQIVQLAFVFNFLALGQFQCLKQLIQIFQYFL